MPGEFCKACGFSLSNRDIEEGLDICETCEELEPDD